MSFFLLFSLIKSEFGVSHEVTHWSSFTEVVLKIASIDAHTKVLDPTRLDLVSGHITYSVAMYYKIVAVKHPYLITADTAARLYALFLLQNIYDD